MFPVQAGLKPWFGQLSRRDASLLRIKLTSALVLFRMKLPRLSQLPLR
jgi:hypothetical protein